MVSVQVPPRTPRGGIPATSDVPVFMCLRARRGGLSCHLSVSVAAVLVVTAEVIEPVVVPVSSRRLDGGQPSSVALRRRRLPLAELAAVRSSSTVYGLASVDCRGRVADRGVPRALGWEPGTRLDIWAVSGVLVVRACPDGVFTVTSLGHLRLPAPVRRWCALVAGDRVLLAAEPDLGRLVVYPLAALDAVLAAFRCELLNVGAS